MRSRDAKPEPQQPQTQPQAEQQPLPLHGAAAAVPAGVCADCGTPATGNYCPHCGQETRIETPTIRHFLHELADQYIAVEGKLGRTLRVLLTKPGQLTRDYVEGRRQRYVRPLKLYLTVSVVFFGLIGLLPDNGNSIVFKLDNKPAQKQAAGKAPADQPADADKDSDKDADEDTDKDTDKDKDAGKAGDSQDKKSGAGDDPVVQAKALVAAEVKKDLNEEARENPGDKLGAAGADFGEKLSEKLQSKSSAFTKLPPKQQRREMRDKIANDAPYTMFFLLPYFALLLGWLYRKNLLRYGVHLLFSLHLHCFAFMVMALGLLPLPGVVGNLLFWGVAAYLFLALRQVYGGGWKRTAWRTFVLGSIYMATVGATILSTVLTTIFGGKA